MNHILSLLELGARGLVSASCQSAVLIVAVLIATWCLRRSRPAVRYALWSVVLIRLCFPFSFTSPLGVAGRPQPVHASISPAVEAMSSDESVQTQDIPRLGDGLAKALIDERDQTPESVPEA